VGSQRKQRRDRLRYKTPSIDSTQIKALTDNAEIRSLVDLAIAAQIDSRFEEANRHLQQALAISPSDARVHAALGSIASHQGNYLKAFQHYSIVEKVTIPTEPLLFALAGLFGKIGNYESAIPYLERAALVASTAAEKRDLPEQHQSDLLEFALVLLHRGRPEALESVRRIFAIHAPDLALAIEAGLDIAESGNSPVLHVIGSVHQAVPHHEFFPTLRAGWLVSFGRDEEAQALLRQTVHDYPAHWRAWGMLSDLAHANQSYDEAADLISKAVEHCPHADSIYPFLIKNRIQTAAFKEAWEAIEEGAAKSKHPEKLRWLGVAVLEAQGEPAKALAFAQQLAEQFPNSFDVRLTLAESLTLRGLYQDALQVQMKLVSLSADHQRLGKQWATWYASQYKFHDAIQVLEKLLVSRPGDTDVMGQLMLMKLCDGDIAGAVAIDRAIDDLLEIKGREKHRFNHRHSFQRGFLREFNTNAWAIEAMGQARSLPPTLQVPRLLRELEREPQYAGFAVATLVRLRQTSSINESRPKKDAAIPKRVSQYWDSTKPPGDVLALMSSWQLKAYDYQRYNDQSAWDFIKQHSDSQVLRAFESSAHPTLRADLIRLAVLSVKGGVWGDADDRCCGSLEAMTGNGYDLVLLQENFGTIGNNFIAAAPHHPFIQYALSVVTNNILERDGDSIWFISGPGALTLAFCHFYRNQLRQLSIPEGVRIIDTYTLSNSVSQHLPLAYKHRGQHWLHKSNRQRSLFRKPSGRPLESVGHLAGSIG
jgi:mannosyltransferase OCH1-like enzyme/tetratricopeptide (TPR) repeat protein